MDFSKYGKRAQASCESCEFYQYDDYTESYSCTLSLDEDEMANFISGFTKDEMEDLRQTVLPYIPNTRIRGI